MAMNNTHRAAGRAVTPLNPSLALKGAGGAAVLGSVMVGSFGAANAAPASAAPAVAPQAHVAAAQPAAQAAPQAAAPAVAPTVSVATGATMARGSAGDRVSSLQNALNDNGASLDVDGVFGPRTHSAVKSFQRDNGLRVDGRVGSQTLAALNNGGASSDDEGDDESTPAASTGTSRSASTSRSGNSSSIVSTARSMIGTPYRFAGASSSGVDCSGLTMIAYSQAGISLPHSAAGQAAGGHQVSKANAQPGDLVYWPGHIGIYAGGDKVIDAGSSPHQVTERTIWGSPTFVSYR